MIMPDKNIRLEYSLLNCGATILASLGERDTLSSLWERARLSESLASYEKFILTLDLLFMLGAISLENGLIVRCKDDKVNTKQ